MNDTIPTPFIIPYKRYKSNKSIGNNPKILNNKNIVVDLIVHKRGCDETYGYDNLICIEMKKSNDSRRAQGIIDDEDRLRKLTNYQYLFNYQMGLMLIADIKNKELYIKTEYYLD